MAADLEWHADGLFATARALEQRHPPTAGEPVPERGDSTLAPA
jgi:hypothetical protein